MAWDDADIDTRYWAVGILAVTAGPPLCKEHVVGLVQVFVHMCCVRVCSYLARN